MQSNDRILGKRLDTIIADSGIVKFLSCEQSLKQFFRIYFQIGWSLG